MSLCEEIIEVLFPKNQVLEGLNHGLSEFFALSDYLSKGCKWIYFNGRWNDFLNCEYDIEFILIQLSSSNRVMQYMDQLLDSLMNFPWDDKE